MLSSLSADLTSPSPGQESWAIVTCKNVASLHRHSIDWKKPDKKENRLSSVTYMESRTSKANLRGWSQKSGYFCGEGRRTTKEPSRDWKCGGYTGVYIHKNSPRYRIKIYALECCVFYTLSLKTCLTVLAASFTMW